jgi:hypothetical protein
VVTSLAGLNPAVAVPAVRRYPAAVSRRTPIYFFLLDTAQGPAELAERNHLLLLLFAQNIAHVDGAYRPVMN